MTKRTQDGWTPERGWARPDWTPDGKNHHVIWVSNTFGRFHVYVDGEHAATWIDHRPTLEDVWRLLAVRFGRFRRIRSALYRISGKMPPAPEDPSLVWGPPGQTATPLAFWRAHAADRDD